MTQKQARTSTHQQLYFANLVSLLSVILIFDLCPHLREHIRGDDEHEHDAGHGDHLRVPVRGYVGEKERLRMG